jgi:hypothetical protein
LKIGSSVEIVSGELTGIYGIVVRFDESVVVINTLNPQLYHY